MRATTGAGPKEVSSLRRTRAAVLAFALLLVAEGGLADDRHEGGLWLVNQVTTPLDDRFAFHTMLQNRWVNDVDRYERTVVRPWFSFAWTDQVELAIGYDRHEFDDTPGDEDRAWQRIAYHHDFGAAAIFTHFWLEERFFESSDSVAWRGRFQIGGSLELTDDLGLVVRNEFFVNFNETSRVRRRNLGENQLNAGFQYAITRWLRFDVGYLMQYRDQSDRSGLFNHSLVTGFSIRTPTLFQGD